MGARGALNSSARPSRPGLRPTLAFTLIEIMIVVIIMGVIMTMGVPPFVRSLRRESVRKAAADLAEACSQARAQAILKSTMTELIFHPKDRRFEVGGASSGAASEDASVPAAGAGWPGQLPDDVTIAMLDVNLREYKEEETARVRFFPNGTSDEMTVVFESKTGEMRGVSLEITTGLADIESDVKRYWVGK